MATISDVKAGLDEIATLIKVSRLKLTTAKAMVTTQETLLNNLPIRFSDVIATIEAYVPDGAFEILAEDELSGLTTEYIALRDATTAAKADLATVTEF
jgi:hypothetical protein